MLLLNRGAIARILQNLESLTLPGGFEAKFKRAVEREVDAVISAEEEPGKTITTRQLEAAERVAELASKQDLRVIGDQMLAAAREYERVRASLPGSHKRTRQMEKVATKMRTLGYAASPLLDDLASSDSPGKRLAAITILQVKPNPQKFEWLADRLGIEKPFVGYHAAVALLTAARVHDDGQTDQLRRAIKTAKERLGDQRRGTDRDLVLDDALSEIDE